MCKTCEHTNHRRKKRKKKLGEILQLIRNLIIKVNKLFLPLKSAHCFLL